MKKIFIIGGMGAGKSTVTKVLADQGLPLIDLDHVGHEVLTFDYVKADLVEAFGEDILDAAGEIDRAVLAGKAFIDERHTSLLNSIMMPRIEEAFTNQVDELASDHTVVVVEYSAFRTRERSLASSADCIVAVLAPVEMRVQRAVAAGWPEEDVRHRLARQISDTDRIDEADVVFHNDTDPESLQTQILAWWDEFQKTL